MLIPYLGEKSRFVNFITPYIPKVMSVYAEPFAGMYGIFFSLDFAKYKNTEFIYNDKNRLNYLLFKNLKNDNFIKLIYSTQVTRGYYKLCIKNILIEKNEELLSLYWLVILTCSSSYENGKDSWIGDDEFKLFKLKFQAYKYHVNKITKIHNLDYKKIIEMYDSESTFFYVDPPYKGYEKHYMNLDFNKKSHSELSTILNNIKGKFLLSCYYFDEMRELYSNCKIESEITRAGTEYIIMNY